jgi:antitoxin MazE
MQAQLIQVGNSKGIRLPKALLQQCSIVDAVDLRVTAEGLLIVPVPAVRAGWEESIVLDTGGSDEFEDFRSFGSAFDDTEWTWRTETC